MVASPEISRLNGRKSRGPRTKRGKAIASRNATKHGLLCQAPPLLVTEDLSTFEGLVQSLIDHYQPQSPVENFLVQQVAMGMLKQYRLWNVESAIANTQILKAQQRIKFPDQVIPPEVNPLEGFQEYSEKRISMKALLEQERAKLEDLRMDLEYDLKYLPEHTEAEILKALRESVGDNYFYREGERSAVWQYHSAFEEWLCESWDKEAGISRASLKEAVARAQKLLKLVKGRNREIDEAIDQIDGHAEAIQQSEAVSKGLQQPELFNRYQREMNRELYEAIDRLEEIQQQRKNQGSIGSFRQIADQTG